MRPPSRHIRRARTSRRFVSALNRRAISRIFAVLLALRLERSTPSTAAVTVLRARRRGVVDDQLGRDAAREPEHRAAPQRSVRTHGDVPSALHHTPPTAGARLRSASPAPARTPRSPRRRPAT